MCSTWGLFFLLFSACGLPTRFNPATYLCGPWLLVFAMNWWNPLDWSPISVHVLRSVVASVAAILFGILLVLLLSKPSSTAVRTWNGGATLAHPCRLVGAARLATGFGLVLLLLHLAFVVGAYGLEPGALGGLRTDLGVSGPASVGFYYFYPMQLAAALWAALYGFDGNKRHLGIAALCLSSLVLTSGRFNTLTTAAWVLLIIFLVRPNRRPLKMTFLVLPAALAVVFFFNFLGVAVGKTWENSYWFRVYGDSPHFPSLLWTSTPISPLRCLHSHGNTTPEESPTRAASWSQSRSTLAPVRTPGAD